MYALTAPADLNGSIFRTMAGAVVCYTGRLESSQPAGAPFELASISSMGRAGTVDLSARPHFGLQINQAKSPGRVRMQSVWNLSLLPSPNNCGLGTIWQRRTSSWMRQWIRPHSPAR